MVHRSACLVTVAPTNPLANDKKNSPRLLPLKVSNNIASLQFYVIDYFESNNENDVDLEQLYDKAEKLVMSLFNLKKTLEESNRQYRD